MRKLFYFYETKRHCRGIEIHLAIEKLCTERLFFRVNHKNELYFSIISFQNEKNRDYVSEINIVALKQQS